MCRAVGGMLRVPSAGAAACYEGQCSDGASRQRFASHDTARPSAPVCGWPLCSAAAHALMQIDSFKYGCTKSDCTDCITDSAASKVPLPCMPCAAARAEQESPVPLGKKMQPWGPVYSPSNSGSAGLRVKVRCAPWPSTCLACARALAAGVRPMRRAGSDYQLVLPSSRHGKLPWAAESRINNPSRWRERRHVHWLREPKLTAGNLLAWCSADPSQLAVPANQRAPVRVDGEVLPAVRHGRRQGVRQVDVRD